MFNSYTIIEKWRGQIQTLSEALSLSYAKEYSRIDKIVQKRIGKLFKILQKQTMNIANSLYKDVKFRYKKY